MTIYPLDPCTQYTFAVAAVTAMGTGPQGSVSETTEPDGKLACRLRIHKPQGINDFILRCLFIKENGLITLVSFLNVYKSLKF